MKLRFEKVNTDKKRIDFDIHEEFTFVEQI